MTDRTAFNSIYARLTDDIVDNVDNVKTAHLRSDEPTTCRRDNVNIVNNVRVSKTLSSPLTSAFSAIERQCSDLVSAADWQRAVEDGRLFIVQWGERAEALGWTAQDLFGLHDPPEQHGPNYRRLSRYVTGLIWLLHGRPVVALAADRAVIGKRIPAWHCVGPRRGRASDQPS